MTSPISSLHERADELRDCARLVALRVRLPALLEGRPLDTLLAELETWRDGRGASASARVSTRRAVERSIRLAEALVRRLRLAPDTCLYRSLGRFALLRAHGVRVTFCMGLPPPPSTGEGHAWLEEDGHPYREEIAQGQYVVTYTRAHVGTG